MKGIRMELGFFVILVVLALVIWPKHSSRTEKEAYVDMLFRTNKD